MTNDVMLLVVLIAAGLPGALLIFRMLRGGAALLALLLWLTIPYIALAAMMLAELDMTLPPDRRAYNFQFGFVLFSLLLTIPWLLANVIGGVIGRLLRPAVAVASPTLPTVPPVAPTPQDGVPDWAHPDLQDIPAIGARIHAIADRIGVPATELPALMPPDGSDGDFVFRDKFEYIYLGIDRGQPCFEHITAVADELLYLIFRDRAYALAANRVAERRVGAEGYVAELMREQQAIIAGIDPRWGSQFAHEQATQDKPIH